MSAPEIRFLGHSCFLITSGEHRILIDPFLAENPVAPLSADDVDADFIVITHGHFDHIADAVPIARRCNATVISNFEIVTWLQNQGVENGHPMNTGGSCAFPFGRLKWTPALHSSSFPDGSYAGQPMGVLLELQGVRIFHAGDTAVFTDMQLIGKSDLTVAILPIGDNFTMGPEDAVTAVNLLRPKSVIPCHYNTWPPIEQNDQAWAAAVRDRTDADPLILKPGDSYKLEES